MKFITKTLNEICKLESDIQVRKMSKGKVKVNCDSSVENNITYESSNVSYMNFPTSTGHENLTKVEVVINDNGENEKIEENDWKNVFGKTMDLFTSKK